MMHLKRLNKILKALSDDSRIRIAFLLNRRNGLCVNEVKELIRLSQPTISSHLKVLEETGLITKRKDGLWVNYDIEANLEDGIKKLLADVFYLMKSSKKVKEPYPGKPGSDTGYE